MAVMYVALARHTGFAASQETHYGGSRVLIQPGNLQFA
jgi:hypothetical protein